VQQYRNMRFGVVDMIRSNLQAQASSPAVRLAISSMAVHSSKSADRRREICARRHQGVHRNR
jgi:hypothetical protein